MKFHPKVVIHPDFEFLRDFISELPERFAKEGDIIYKGRNELRLYHVKGYDLVVKSYKRPNIVNRVAYGFLRSSKAERAYRYGLFLLEKGFGTPTPVGFVTCRRDFLFENSYSISLQSTCPYTYRDFSKWDFSRRKEILETIALFTARLHENNILHKDYSAGNILFDDKQEQIPLEIIDLNRIVFKQVGLEEGCRNFERLPGSDEMLEIMGTIYARARGFDPDICIGKIKEYVRKEIEMRNRKSKNS